MKCISIDINLTSLVIMVYALLPWDHFIKVT